MLLELLYLLLWIIFVAKPPFREKIWDSDDVLKLDAIMLMVELLDVVCSDSHKVCSIEHLLDVVLDPLAFKSFSAFVELRDAFVRHVVVYLIYQPSTDSIHQRLEVVAEQIDLLV